MTLMCRDDSAWLTAAAAAAAVVSCQKHLASIVKFRVTNTSATLHDTLFIDNSINKQLGYGRETVRRLLQYSNVKVVSHFEARLKGYVSRQCLWGEWVCLTFNVKGLTSHSTHNRSFGDESFQAINCTGTDNQNNQTQHYIHQKHKRETEKTALANKTI